MITTTKRTLDWCKSQGYSAQVVEKWNAFAKKRVDLFGCIDLVYVTGEHKSGVIGVQCTATSSLSERQKKIAELLELKSNNDAVYKWLVSGNVLELHGWAKRGDRGKRKVWTLKRLKTWINTHTRNIEFLEVDDNV